MVSKFTNAEKAAEALREVQMRNEVYGRHSGGKLSPAQARRIEIMIEIALEYDNLAKAERLI